MIYTVIAVYEHDHGRFATSVEAETTEQAEEMAQAEAEGPIIVAGVVAGAVDMVA